MLAASQVCECVMILRGMSDVSWKAAKAMMKDGNFLLGSLVDFDRDGLDDKQVTQVKAYFKDNNFTPEKMIRISKLGSGV